MAERSIFFPGCVGRSDGRARTGAMELRSMRESNLDAIRDERSRADLHDEHLRCARGRVA